ncbi:MAG: tRNA (adenosine(37)-N6)-dimethylallyltransferase MiaA [Burkholderiales bacterium]|nr:tRNA (adenosine(37)-N6)-dimethylallyltransferase MiaA [Burkholderiales bacterium]
MNAPTPTAPNGTNPPSPIALVGPTASGKSAVSLHLARRWPLEIISIDSALVYRGMDIGTAKPTPAELAEVPHHLIDIRNPDQPYSAAEFAADATRLIADIQSRGKHPLLVGGTMLYLKALLHPMDDMPPAQPELRAQLEAEAYEQGWPALHAQLALVDPTTAARLSPNDSQRVGRALEVFRATGKPLSSFHSGGAAGGKAPALNMPVISLEPTDRAWLHHRIARRFDAMLNEGLVDEVLRLMALPHFHPDLPSMRCVGYRQIWEVLQWQQTLPGSALQPGTTGAADSQNSEQTNTANQYISPKMFRHIRETGIAATRQLAKRQLTWLRGMPERVVEACDAPGLAERVEARVRPVWG